MLTHLQINNFKTSIQRCAYILLLGIFGFCGCESQHSEDTDTEGNVDTSGIADIFDQTRVVEVSLTLNESDWDTIRFQTRDFMALLNGDDCMETPFESPFTYVSADVAIDGVLIKNVGLRKKGFLGSLDDDKPSLKIKFNKYIQGIEVQGYERMTLNNSVQDPSLIRQCLGYQVFAAANIPAPKCNFAHVTVNGNDLGIYAHVESVKKQFLRSHFDNPDGDLYEGTLSDFREGWTGTFEKKTNKEQAQGDHILMVKKALDLPEDNFVDQLETQLDLDAFFTFWATEVIIGHWDGYAGNTNNFFIYDNPDTGLFEFLPWGIDGIMNPAQENSESVGPHSVYATGHLARRLYLNKQTQAKYVGRLKQLLETAWDEEALLASIDNMEYLLSPYVENWVTFFIDDVRNFVRTQRGKIENELEAGPPQWTEPLPDVFCMDLDPIGSLDVSFNTTFDTLDDGDFFEAGSGSFSGSLHGEDINPVLVGAVSGFDTFEDGSVNSDQVIVMIPAIMSDDTVLIAYAMVSKDQFHPGANLNVDFLGETAVLLGLYNPADDSSEIIGMLVDGTIGFSEAATNPGQSVEGTITGTLIKNIFEKSAFQQKRDLRLKTWRPERLKSYNK